MKSFYIFITLFFFGLSTNAQVYHNLSAGPFRQDWTDTTLIRVADDWSNVPSIIGYIGNDFTTTIAPVDPQTALTMIYSDTVDVIPGIKAPKGNGNGGVGEMEIENPVVAFQGSGSADAPNIIIYLNTSNSSNIRVKYKLRDVDSSADNSLQSVALQYRLGNTGDFVNIPEAFVADASEGPGIGGKVTDVNVILPVACENQELLQLRIMTGNASGTDEWIGVDDIEIDKDASTNVRNFMLAPSAVRILSNPAESNDVFVSFNQILKGQVSLSLFDQGGRILSTRIISNVLVGQTERISIDNLPSGIYYLQVHSKEGYHASKIIR